MAKRNLRGLASTLPNGSAVAEFNNYQEAVSYVERIILGDFPVSSIAIVGTNLTSVERVRAKISYGRIAFNGAMTGIWLGLLAFIIFGTVPGETPEDPAQPLFNLGSAILVGAGLGMLFQVIRFSLSRTKRGFASTSQIVAAKYEVLVPSELINEANSAYEKGGELKA
jgi:hypothetical protein